MNKRLRELAVQAREALAVDAMSGGEFNMKAYEEKFAELIVRECADKAHEFIIADGDEFPLQAVSYRIKEHFGVE